MKCPLTLKGPDLLTTLEFQVTLQSESLPSSLRTVGSDHVSRLVKIQGIVVAASGIKAKATNISLQVQSFEGEVHYRKRKCIPFLSPLPPSFFVVVSCALCSLLALQHRREGRMGNVIFFSISNLALANMKMHFFFKPLYKLGDLSKV